MSGSLYGGDPCPNCGARLDYDEVGEEREPMLFHPAPQCGWLPDGYPSTVAGFVPAGHVIPAGALREGDHVRIGGSGITVTRPAERAEKENDR